MASDRLRDDGKKAKDISELGSGRTYGGGVFSAKFVTTRQYWELGGTYFGMTAEIQANVSGWRNYAELLCMKLKNSYAERETGQRNIQIG